MQVKCAKATEAAWQRAQQDLHKRDPLSTTDGGATSAPNSVHDDDLAKEASLPVYSIPGIHIRLPTLAGTVSFTPVFLSKEQLDKTWVSHADCHPGLNACIPFPQKVKSVLQLSDKADTGLLQSLSCLA